MKEKATFQTLKNVIKALRDPDTGCPWDLEQDHSSIKKYFIEETYEALEAIDSGNDEELKAELGDVLLQVMLHSQIATDRGAFDIDDVVEGITEKMIRRHPHVFSNATVQSSEEVKKNWEAIKKQEKKSSQPESSPKKYSQSSYTALLKDVPKALPALIQAERIGDKAAQSGFDWPEALAVWKKVEEERNELVTELERTEFNPSKEERKRIAEELGDLLFSLVQLGRWLKISPEDSLRTCCHRFIQRFEQMEKLLGGKLEGLRAEELEQAWQAAKKMV